MEPKDIRSPAIRWLAILVLLYCAVAVSLSWIHSFHNSDTVIPALVSLDRYSPFYWSENRFGMLIPALASVVRDYAANLILQSFLIVIAGIGLSLLEHFLQPPRSRSDTALYLPLLLAVLVVTFKPLAVLILLLPGSPYLTAFALLFAALYVLYGTMTWPVPLRWLAAFVLFGLSLWVNISNVVITVAAIALWPRAKAGSLMQRAFAAFLAVAAATTVVVISRFYPGQEFRDFLPPERWIPSLFTIVGKLSNFARPAVLAVILGLSAIAAAFRFRALRYDFRVAVLAGCILQICATAASAWVARNQYDPRYIAGPLVLMLYIATSYLAEPLAKGFEHAFGSVPARICGLLFAAAFTTHVFGAPSLSRALQAMDAQTHAFAQQVNQLGCSHFIGDYWNVWKTVFDNRLHRGKQQFWGLSFRAEETRFDWDGVPHSERTYCAVCTDPQIDYMRAVLRIAPLQKTGEAVPICSYQGR